MTQRDKFDININDIKSFDIKEYILKIISHWKMFLVMLIFGLLITTYLNKRAQRIYSLNSVITVKEEQNPLAIAAVLASQAMGLYKTVLSDNDYDSMIESLVDKKDSVEPYESRSLH